MLRIRASVLTLLLSLAMQGAGGCGARQNETRQNENRAQNSNAVATPTPGRTEEAVNGEIKVLAEGAYGKITAAFVAVARDAETYAAVRELVGNLPQLNADFFQKNLVVAAFLGQRNTGGYGVEITRTANNRLRVSSRTPPKGAMTTQALTAPFKIVSAPLDETRPLSVEIDAAWNSETRPYRVASGEFTTGGGFAGRFEKLQLSGEIRVIRLGPLATLVFDVKGTGGAKARLLMDAATGKVAANGQLGGAVADPGSLVDVPRSALAVKGGFTANEDKLSLTFESLPSNVSDGYGGQGKLEATATAPPPPKKPVTDDAPM